MMSKTPPGPPKPRPDDDQKPATSGPHVPDFTDMSAFIEPALAAIASSPQGGMNVTAPPQAAGQAFYHPITSLLQFLAPLAEENKSAVPHWRQQRAQRADEGRGTNLSFGTGGAGGPR